MHMKQSIQEAIWDAGTAFFASLIASEAAGLGVGWHVVYVALLMGGISFFRHRNHRTNGHAQPTP